MPLGVALTTLRTGLRAETGQTLNVAQGVQSQASQDNQLDRQQREVWEAHQWQHLPLFTDKTINEGQQLIDYPEEMPLDQIQRIFISDGATNDWKVLNYGIHAFDVPAGTPPTGTPGRWGNKVTVTGGKTNPVGQIQLVPV